MTQEKGINVLSLFDGISIAQLTLKQLNVPINNYYSSEIDKQTIKVTQHHFPNTIELGDVKKVDGRTLSQIDLMVWGSPCQNLSTLRKNRSGLDSEDSGLFYEAFRIFKEVNPRYYLMENVSSMPINDKNIITNLLGVEPLRINSELVAPAFRNRYYWTNIPGVTIPNKRNILLKTIIEDGFVDRDKANCILTKNVSHTKNGLIRYLTKSIGNIVYYDKDFAELSKHEKLKHIENLSDVEVKSLFRLLTINELERCQTLPDGYVDDILKKTASFHAIGNAFTLEVIKHILSFANFK